MKKQAGISNTQKFILTGNTPIIKIKGSKAEQGDTKLMRGTIIEGMVKTRILSQGKEKVPYKLIEIKDKKGYVSPESVNLYINNFANLDGNPQDKTRDTAFGEKPTTEQKIKNTVVNWGLPILGGVVGFQVAKKMNADGKKMFGYIAFFTLLGFIPRYLTKK